MEIDRKTLKALGADTRMDILKSLKERRKTPSELAKELNLSPPTILEHLSKLEGADLVKREETGHKWVYYNLTRKGLNLVKPRFPTQFVIVLGLSVILVFALSYSILLSFEPAMMAAQEKTFDERDMEIPSVAEIEQNITQNVTNNTSQIP